MIVEVFEVLEIVEVAIEWVVGKFGVGTASIEIHVKIMTDVASLF